VQKNERIREKQTQELISAIRAGAGRAFPNIDIKMIEGIDKDMTSTDRDPYVISTDYTSETVTQFATMNNALGLSHLDTEPEPVTPTLENRGHHDVLPTLATIQDVQNSLDAARDSTDLRQLMRAALQTNSDAEMLEVLQVRRQEMPEAMKTLQRAYERLSERDMAEGGSSMEGSGTLPPKGVILGKITRKVSLKEGAGPEHGPPQRSSTVISMESSSSSEVSTSGASSSEIRRRDTLDREFIETGIDALRRMSRGVETTVPTWTITKLVFLILFWKCRRDYNILIYSFSFPDMKLTETKRSA